MHSKVAMLFFKKIQCAWIGEVPQRVDPDDSKQEPLTFAAVVGNYGSIDGALKWQKMVRAEHFYSDDNDACSEAGMKRSLSAADLNSSDAERALQVQEVRKCMDSMSTGEVESYFNDGPSNQSRLSIPSNAQTSVISGNQFSGSGNVYNFDFCGK